MTDKINIRKILTFSVLVAGSFVMTSCDKDDDNDNNSNNPGNPSATSAVFLLIDEESIDNGNPPNNFSDVDVNDQLADIGLRQELKYFKDNVGQTIDLFTGQVGDEGWFVPRTIPASWISAGPTGNGTRNYFVPGPGLGGTELNGDRESLLDEVPAITPLRAAGITMLVGKTVYAVVFDSDVSINYSPLKGNIKGANLGVVAFDVLKAVKRTDGSSSDLPRVTIRIRSVTDVSALPLKLFSNAPVPTSSSEPFDITPPATAPAAVLTDAP